MATQKKTAQKARDISRELLQEHIRNARGAGRKPVASIIVLREVKEQFDCFKAAYSARAGAATSEQVLRRWMDGIGTAFDYKVAQESGRLYRQHRQIGTSPVIILTKVLLLTQNNLYSSRQYYGKKSSSRIPIQEAFCAVNRVRFWRTECDYKNIIKRNEKRAFLYAIHIVRTASSIHMPQFLPPIYHKSYRQNTANLTVKLSGNIWQNIIKCLNCAIIQ